MKSHRAALDFDRGFIITSVLTSADFVWKEELESGDTKNSITPCKRVPRPVFFKMGAPTHNRPPKK